MLRALHSFLPTLFLFITAGCASPSLPPLTPGSLGFRVIQDQGVASIQGLATVPAALFSATYTDTTNSETPLVGATLDLLDVQGNPESTIKSTQSDTTGHFQLIGAPRGVPGFLRARFQGPDGKSHALYAYTRPDTNLSCVEVSFVTSLLAEKLAQNSSLSANADPQRLAALLNAMRSQVPAALAWLFASKGMNTLVPGALQSLLESLTEQTIGLLSSVEQPNTVLDHLLDWLFANTPGLADEWAHVSFGDASVDVAFTLQSLGHNASNYPHAQDGSHLMRGVNEVFWRVPQSQFTGVVFSLNAQPVGQATFLDGAWRATLDTRSRPDGPCVLMATGKPQETKASIFLKAYVYLQNQTAEDPTLDATCAATQTTTNIPEGAIP